MSRIAIEVKPFGVFRSFGAVYCVINLGDGISAIKEALIAKLGTEQRQLVADSVLADDERILPADTIFSKPTTLSILPPVCGG